MLRRLKQHQRPRDSKPEPEFDILKHENLIDEKVYQVILAMRNEAVKIEDRHTREKWLDALQTFARTGNIEVLLKETEWRRQPVDMETFLYDKFYLGLERGSIYPKVEESIFEIDSGDFNEIVLMGAIGIGKTTVANIGIARDIYNLSCMRNPQTSYGVQGKSFITFTMQSVRWSTAKLAIFGEFAAMINASPYFRRVFPYDRKTTTMMVFPEHRIRLMPVTSSTTSVISMNTIGGMMDEANFMQKILKSKAQNADEEGVFDQAKELYNTLAGRRKSRFNRRGKMPGKLYLASSSRYPTDFTQERAKKALMYGGDDPGIYVFNYAQWEAKPRSSFLDEEFKVQIGNENHRSRILAEGEAGAPGCKVISVPMDFHQEFRDDPDKAIRDYAGLTVFATNPFIVRRETIKESFDLAAKYGYESPYNLPQTDFRQGVPIPNIEKLRKDVNNFRVAHVDLGLRKDAAGVAIGHIAGFKVGSKKDEETGTTSMSILPVIAVDAVMRIVPPHNGEIDLSDVRRFLKLFRDKGDMPLKYVLTDGFQSADSRQILAKDGFITDYQSVEKIESYRTMRDALYDGRLFVPEHLHFAKEMRELEVGIVNNKERVDHPPSGTKDLTDAVCGVVQFLMGRRSTWATAHIDQGPGYHLFGNLEARKINLTGQSLTAAAGQVEDVKGLRKSAVRRSLARRKTTRI